MCSWSALPDCYLSAFYWRQQPLYIWWWWQFCLRMAFVAVGLAETFWCIYLVWISGFYSHFFHFAFNLLELLLFWFCSLLEIIFYAFSLSFQDVITAFILFRVLVLNNSPGSSRVEPWHSWTDHVRPITDIHVGCGGCRARVVTGSRDNSAKVLCTTCIVNTCIVKSKRLKSWI